MAKVKIRAINELIEIGEDKARKLKDMLMDNEIPKDHKFDLGHIAAEKKDISAIFISPEVDPGKDYYLDYRRHRMNKLNQTIEQKVAGQEKYFNLVKEIFSLQEYWGDVQEKTRNNLKEHPFRIWADYRIWLPENLPQKTVGEFQQHAIKMILAVESSESREEKISLAAYGI